MTISRPLVKSVGLRAAGFIFQFKTAFRAASSSVRFPLLLEIVACVTLPLLARTIRSLTEPSELLFSASPGNSGFAAESQSLACDAVLVIANSVIPMQNRTGILMAIECSRVNPCAQAQKKRVCHPERS